MLPIAHDTVDETGIDAEIIDLRTLDPLGMDWEMIGASIRRTNRLTIVEETTRGTSIGAHIVKRVQELFFEWLDHEIIHVTGTHSSPMVSKALEQAALAGKAQVVRGLREVIS